MLERKGDKERPSRRRIQEVRIGILDQDAETRLRGSVGTVTRPDTMKETAERKLKMRIAVAQGTPLDTALWPQQAP